jgi:hypothetical protein
MNKTGLIPQASLSRASARKPFALNVPAGVFSMTPAHSCVMLSP